MRSCGKCVDGMVEVGGRAYECECSLLPLLSASMPAYIRCAAVETAHFEHPVTRMVDRSLLIRAAWSDMKALLKATIYRHHSLHWRITSDSEIKDVGVGSASRRAMGEDAAIVYNSLSDLMAGPRLMIVRLNKLAYKNKAAAGFLEEALCVRSDYSLPTWAFSDLNSPFGPASFAYSESVWDLLHSAFLAVEVPRIAAAIVPGPPAGRPDAVANGTRSTQPVRPGEVLGNAVKSHRGSLSPSPDGDADARPSKVAAYGQGLSSKGRRRGN